jgi:hypothetical protein
LLSLLAACNTLSSDGCGAEELSCAAPTCAQTIASVDSTKLIGRADVYLAGKAHGSVRTLQGTGAKATTVTTVLNHQGQVVGYVQADGTAMRNTANGAVRVGQGPDLRELVALIFEVRDGSKAELKAVHGQLVPGFPGHL